MKNKTNKYKYLVEDEDFNVIKGLMFAIPVGAIFWGIIIWMICRD